MVQSKSDNFEDVRSRFEAFHLVYEENSEDWITPDYNILKTLYESMTGFKCLTHISEDETNGLVECALKYIEYIMNYCSQIEINRKNVFTLREFLNVLPDIFITYELKNTFVDKASKNIFNFILESWAKPWFSKELLKTYNTVVHGSCRNIRQKALDEMGIIYLYKLIDMLSVHGDYEFQTVIIETVFRICKADTLDKLSCDFIPESKELSKALLSINLDTFDEDVRPFLNLFNMQKCQVYSVICNLVMLDTITFEESSQFQKYKGIWVDFDLKDGTVSWMCDAGVLKSQIKGDDISWEIITVLTSSVQNIEIDRCKANKRKELTVTLHLNSSCIASSNLGQKIIDKARTLHLKVTDANKINYLITKVFPELFGKKYLNKSEVHKKHSSEKSFRPLDIKFSRNKKSATMNISASNLSFSDTNVRKESTSGGVPSVKSVSSEVDIITLDSSESENRKVARNSLTHRVKEKHLTHAKKLSINSNSDMKKVDSLKNDVDIDTFMIFGGNCTRNMYKKVSTPNMCTNISLPCSHEDNLQYMNTDMKNIKISAAERNRLSRSYTPVISQNSQNSDKSDAGPKFMNKYNNYKYSKSGEIHLKNKENIYPGHDKKHKKLSSLKHSSLQIKKFINSDVESENVENKKISCSKKYIEASMKVDELSSSKNKTVSYKSFAVHNNLDNCLSKPVDSSSSEFYTAVQELPAFDASCDTEALKQDQSEVVPLQENVLQKRNNHSKKNSSHDKYPSLTFTNILKSLLQETDVEENSEEQCVNNECDINEKFSNTHNLPGENIEQRTYNNEISPITINVDITKHNKLIIGNPNDTLLENPQGKIADDSEDLVDEEIHKNNCDITADKSPVTKTVKKSQQKSRTRQKKKPFFKIKMKQAKGIPKQESVHSSLDDMPLSKLNSLLPEPDIPDAIGNSKNTLSEQLEMGKFINSDVESENVENKKISCPKKYIEASMKVDELSSSKNKTELYKSFAVHNNVDNCLPKPMDSSSSGFYTAVQELPIFTAPCDTEALKRGRSEVVPLQENILPNRNNDSKENSSRDKYPSLTFTNILKSLLQETEGEENTEKQCVNNESGINEKVSNTHTHLPRENIEQQKYNNKISLITINVDMTKHNALIVRNPTDALLENPQLQITPRVYRKNSPGNIADDPGDLVEGIHNNNCDITGDKSPATETAKKHEQKCRTRQKKKPFFKIKKKRAKGVPKQECVYSSSDEIPLSKLNSLPPEPYIPDTIEPSKNTLSEQLEMVNKEIDFMNQFSGKLRNLSKKPKHYESPKMKVKSFKPLQLECTDASENQLIGNDGACRSSEDKQKTHESSINLVQNEKEMCLEDISALNSPSDYHLSQDTLKVISQDILKSLHTEKIVPLQCSSHLKPEQPAEIMGKADSHNKEIDMNDQRSRETNPHMSEGNSFLPDTQQKDTVSQKSKDYNNVPQLTSTVQLLNTRTDINRENSLNATNKHKDIEKLGNSQEKICVSHSVPGTVGRKEITITKNTDKSGILHTGHKVSRKNVVRTNHLQPYRMQEQNVNEQSSIISKHEGGNETIAKADVLEEKYMEVGSAHRDIVVNEPVESNIPENFEQTICNLKKSLGYSVTDSTFNNRNNPIVNIQSNADDVFTMISNTASCNATMSTISGLRKKRKLYNPDDLSYLENTTLDTLSFTAAVSKTIKNKSIPEDVVVTVKQDSPENYKSKHQEVVMKNQKVADFGKKNSNRPKLTEKIHMNDNEILKGRRKTTSNVKQNTHKTNIKNTGRYACPEIDNMYRYFENNLSQTNIRTTNRCSFSFDNILESFSKEVSTRGTIKEKKNPKVNRRINKCNHLQEKVNKSIKTNKEKHINTKKDSFTLQQVGRKITNVSENEELNYRAPKVKIISNIVIGSKRENHKQGPAAKKLKRSISSPNDTSDNDSRLSFATLNSASPTHSVGHISFSRDMLEVSEFKPIRREEISLHCREQEIMSWVATGNQSHTEFVPTLLKSISKMFTELADSLRGPISGNAAGAFKDLLKMADILEKYNT